jgi:hypothetical protein
MTSNIVGFEKGRRWIPVSLSEDEELVAMEMEGVVSVV